MILSAVGVACLVHWIASPSAEDFQDEFLNAVYKGDIRKVTKMLNAGENPNKRDAYGNNPMTLAAFAGHTEILKLLLTHAGQLDSRDDTGMTPLHCTAYYNRTQAARFLLQSGAEVNATNRYGLTPLSESVMKGFPNMVKMLLEAGASVTNRDDRGWQPLHQVLRSKLDQPTRVQIVTLLLDHGADPNAANPGGWEKDSEHDSMPSPLAILQQNNPNKGNTPLAIAESNGFRDVADLLKKHEGKK